MDWMRRSLDSRASVTAGDTESPRHLLWLDLTPFASGELSRSHLAGRCRITSIHDWDAVPGAVEAQRPDAMAIEFDRPQCADLAPIGALARRFPALPVIVLSTGHSEALVVEAMRMRAWDFLVKPLAPAELQERIDALLVQATARDTDREPDASLSVTVPIDRTAPAIAYVAERFRDHVSLSDAADACHLSVSQFSRLFKREHGETFNHFVSEYRIRRACDLLSRSPAPVKQVGFGVGFSDLAYFSRAFRRLVGVCPSQFRTTGRKP